MEKDGRGDGGKGAGLRLGNPAWGGAMPERQYRGRSDVL